MYFSPLTFTIAIFQSPVVEVPEISMEASRGQSVSPTVSPTEPVVPEPITLPHLDEWDIFITCCGSTAEVWGRLIGEEYSVSVCYWFRLNSLSGIRKTRRFL
jgi:hypothetical protein